MPIAAETPDKLRKKNRSQLGKSPSTIGASGVDTSTMAPSAKGGMNLD